MPPLWTPATSFSEASKPTKLSLPARFAFSTARSMPKVVDSFGVNTPATLPSAAPCASNRLSLALCAVSVVAPPYWLSERIFTPAAFSAARQPSSR